MFKKIVSGGHPGAEKAALDAAIKLDIPHSGWAYKGRKTDDGILPEEYKVKEISDKSFSNRIKKNVIDAAGVVIFAYGKPTIGLKMIEELASVYQRPYLHIDLRESSFNIAAATIRAWMIKNEIESVYVTGQKSVKGADIYSEVMKAIEGIQRMDTEDSETQNL
jgi:hypothetical protein